MTELTPTECFGPALLYPVVGRRMHFRGRFLGWLSGPAHPVKPFRRDGAEQGGHASGEAAATPTHDSSGQQVVVGAILPEVGRGEPIAW